MPNVLVVQSDDLHEKETGTSRVYKTQRMKQKEDHKVCDIYYFGFVCHQKTVTFSTVKDKGCYCSATAVIFIYTPLQGERQKHVGVREEFT